MVSGKPSIKDILASAEAAERAGDTARALAIYSNILAKFPKHSKAKKALSRLRKTGGGGQNRMTQADAAQLGQMVQQGAFAQVLEQTKLLMVHNRKEPFLYNIQGLAYTHLNQPKPAITAYKHALKLNPNFIEAYNNLGLGLIKDNRPQDAVPPLQKAIAKRPGYPEAHHNLGVALTALGREDEALAALGEAIRLRPTYANAFNSRGSAHSQFGQLSEAITDYRRAYELAPKDAEIVNNLASALAKAEKAEQALAFAEMAVELDPRNTEYQLSLAVMHNAAGDMEAARACIEKLLTIDPHHAHALRFQTRFAKMRADSPHVDVMKQLFDDPQTPTVDRAQLGFGLAKVYEDIGDFAAAFSHLEIANDLNFGLLEYSVQAENDRFDRLKSTYTPALLNQLTDCGNPSETPIFIVGLMRSGTSLVEQILSSHSQVYGAGELMLVTDLVEKLGLKQTAPDAETLGQFSQKYLSEITRKSAGAARVTDKMPDNFRHIGLLKLAFPQAKIINMVRDPRDNCYSIYKNFFDTQAHQYAYHLEYLANYANKYKDLMAHWHKLFPGQIYDCCYESMIADQTGESRKLLDYCGLEWQPQVLDFHKNKRAVRTASVNQVRQKIYKTSVRSWEHVSEGLSPLIAALDKKLWAQYLE